MGLKENFAQAVRELTGGGKEENTTGKKGVRVENLRRAIEDDRFESRPKNKTIDDSEFPNNKPKNGTKDFPNGVLKTEPKEFQNGSKDFQNGFFRKGNNQVKTDTAPIIIPTSLEINPVNGETKDKKISEPVKDFYAQTNPGAYPFQSANAETQGANNTGDTYRSPPQSQPAPPPAANQQPFYNQPKPQVFPSQPDAGNNQNPPHYEGEPQATNNIQGNAYPNVGTAYANNNKQYNGNHTVETPVFKPGRNDLDDEITIISKNTVIDGNVRSFANMSIDGDVKGDVETTKNIDLNGRIVGNLTCNNAEMHTSQIQGNVRMKGSIDMERDTLLIGDIVSTYARVNGKVKGNLDVAGKAELKSDAVVFGDISASTITVDDGAIIQGYVSTTFLNKEESRNIFPDVITISD